ncbi:MAG TPA: tetratricopeptide repeat protein [Actinospica sp.]|jgi:tetratricopeptide (TPR) repeat protein|nr:tetratricopeptide repeat protein [Actinospica sp.]
MNQNANGRDAAGSAAKPPLAEQARVLQRLMAGAGESWPAAVLAALADLPTATAHRHLEHLVRAGSALRAGDEYAPVPGQQVQNPITPDLAAWARVADWYLASAYRAADVLGSVALPANETISESLARPPLAPRAAAEAIAWYQATHTRLRSVMERAAAAGDHRRVWQLALLTLNIAAVAGPAGDWRTATELGLNAAYADQAEGAAAMVKEYQGKLMLACGEIEDARTLQEQVRAWRAAAGDEHGMVRSFNALGLVELRAGHLAAAEPLFRKALACAEALEFEEFATYARLNLGAVLARTGAPGEAKDLLNQAINALRASGRAPYEADGLRTLAGLHRRCGQLRSARELIDRALEVASRAGLPLYLAAVLTELAAVQKAEGDLQAGLASLHEARLIYLELGDELRAEQVATWIVAASEARPCS